jgi:ribose 5-phosphate isomerase A
MSHHDGPISIKEMKRNAAAAALDFIEPGTVIGVGSGTTVWCFIDMLAQSGIRIAGAVAASREAERRLSEIGVEIVGFGDQSLALYVDGADEVDMSGRAIKGGGGAHTLEKRIAEACEYWACIVDATKIVRVLGARPVPLEVAEGFSASVIAALREMGARAEIRPDRRTDAGNEIVDAHGLSLVDPLAVELALDAIPGVLGNGVFARRRADVILVGRAGGGVSRIVPQADDDV